MPNTVPCGAGDIIVHNSVIIIIFPARIAQLVEQQTVMQQVLNSIPTQTWLGVDSAFHPSVGK